MTEDKKKLRKPGQQKLMNKLKKSQKEGADARARKKITKDSGTFTSRVEKAKKSPKPKGGPLAIRKETLPAVRKENLPAVRKENVPAVRKDKLPAVRKENLPARLGGGAGASGGGAGGVIRKMLPGAWRAVGGPAAMLVSMTEPAGEGSDKPSGPLMKGGKQPGYKYRDDGASVLERKKEVRQATPGLSPDPEFIKQQIAKKKASVGGGEDKPRVQAPIPKARPARAGEPKVAKPRAAEPRKSFADKAKAAPKPSFRANWVGAAPTAMQARGGAKIRRKSLRDLLRKD